jgi:hypothetical protein
MIDTLKYITQKRNQYRHKVCSEKGAGNMKRSIFLITSIILIMSITLPVFSPLVIKANALYDEIIVHGKEKPASKQAPSSKGSMVVHYPANTNKP